MDIEFLLEYINPITLGLCLAMGYALKTAFNTFPNKYIPLAALCIGTLIAILTSIPTGINAKVILSGMISGLASTGLYEMLRNLFKFDGKSEV